MRTPESCLGFVLWPLLLATTFCRADDRPAPGTRRALILVGLPGDSAHESLFRETARQWKAWLTGPLGFPPGQVRILSGAAGTDEFADAPGTGESVRHEVESLRKRATREDRVWVFVLGHANLDGGHAFLHLPGPDLRDDEFATLFRDLSAGEQVFWMTSSGSGAFLPPLSKTGRVVAVATERTGEVNETEFPHALAEVSRRPPKLLDLDKDGKVSVLEIFRATTEAVEARFRADKRAPTEHAQVDDDGDGVGTELKPGGTPEAGDGPLAGRTFLPTVEPKAAPKPSPRSEHGTDRIAPPAR